MTQQEAYEKLVKLAEKAKMSVFAYCESKGVSRAVPSYWNNVKGKDVKQETLDKLGIK